MDFTKTIKDFFGQKKIVKKFGDSQLFFLRKDGVLLFTNRDPADAQSISALMGGIWQAAAAVSDFIPHFKKEEVYRLTFDTSSKGVYILPVEIFNGEFYLGAIYYNKTNPAVVKHELREIHRLLLEEMAPLSTKASGKTDSKFLFKDISDDEINSIFSTVGH